MKMKTKLRMKPVCHAIAGIAMWSTMPLQAGTEVWFNPLTASANVGIPNHPNELAQPWIAPAGITQRNLTSLREVESSVTQSIVRAPGAGNVASMIDMIAFDARGKFLFLPHETP